MNINDDVDRLLSEDAVGGLMVRPGRLSNGQPAKRVVYTAILADNDVLNTPLYAERSCDYICFTDSDQLASKFWRIVRIPLDPVVNPYMVAKALKVLGADLLREYEESIWVDGSVLLKKDPWLLIEKVVAPAEFAFMKHPDRTCTYEEIEACTVQRKDSKTNLEAVRVRLLAAGYPRNNGLISGGFIYRSHQAQVRLLFREWMKNIVDFSRRDQLTFNYTCWRAGRAIKYVDLDIFNNEYFAVLPHFATLVGKLKWIRKYVLVWSNEKIARLSGHLLRDRRLPAEVPGSERKDPQAE